MRRVILLTGLALAVGVLLPASALPAAGGSDLPIKGYSSGYVVANLSTGQSEGLTSGPASHLGWATAEQDFQLAQTGPGSFTWSATWTVTAANGDEMFGTATGTGSTLDGVHFSWLGNYASTGGTGRFAGASMTFVATIQTTRISVSGAISRSTAEATLVGTLSY